MAHDDEVTAGQADGDRVRVFDSYGRLSRVPETGELEKVEVQHADNRRVIERLGGVLGEELSDGMSAWRKGVRRPGWEQLLERVRSGVSAGCVVWHTDRLFRQPRDLETLIDLADKGYTVSSAHGTRDLSDPDDRFILRIEVAHAARSSDDTARRIRRRFETKRAQGHAYTGGLRWFGFPGLERDPSGDDGERLPVSDALVAAERAAIREAAAGLLSGDTTFKGIARAWNAAEVRTPKGLEWTVTSVRDTLKRPALGGWVVHRGEVVGRMDDEPILDAETYDRLHAWFAGRKRGRQAGERYVASGVLRCGGCGNKLSGRRYTNAHYADGARRAVYYCAKDRRGCGRVYIDMRSTDEVLREFTVARLADPTHAAMLEADETSARVNEIREEISQLGQLQQALSDRLGRRQVTLEAFDTANQPLVADLERLQAELAELEPDTEAVTAETADDADPAVTARLAQEWDAGDAAERRAMLAKALGRQRMAVALGGKRGNFDPARIQLQSPDAGTE